MEAGNRVIVRSDAAGCTRGPGGGEIWRRWVGCRIAPSGWEWDGSQPGQGESGLLSPGPALGEMQDEPARRAGDPSGQGEEVSP